MMHGPINIKHQDKLNVFRYKTHMHTQKAGTYNKHVTARCRCHHHIRLRVCLCARVHKTQTPGCPGN